MADMGVLLLKEPGLGSLEEMSYISCGFGLFLKKGYYSQPIVAKFKEIKNIFPYEALSSCAA